MACGADEYKRFQLLDEFFSSGKKATVKELVDYIESRKHDFNYNIKAGVSDKILYKVLDTMRDELHAPLVQNSEHRYYYNSSKTLTKPGFLSREETGKTIRLVNNLLETIKDTPIYEEASKLCKEITEEAPLLDKYGKGIKKIEQTAAGRVVFLGAPASDVKDSIWSEIYKAMEENYFIVIKYVAPGYTESVSRGIKPYQLIFDNGIWDLWGYDCIKKKNLLYNLSRIKSVEIRKDTDRFELPPDFDFHRTTPGTFGCYRDDGKENMTTYKIHMKKGSYAESFAKERIWGINSSIVENEKGTIITFDNNQYLPILRWILSWGPDAIPLEPDRLVNDWKERIKEMSKNF